MWQENVIWLDEVEKESRDYPLTAELPQAKPENLAYMIYTSGFTGKAVCKTWVHTVRNIVSYQ